MTTIWQRFTADLGVAETDLKSVLSWGESLFKTVVEEEVQLVLPLAKTAVAEVVADAGSLTTAGGWLAALEGIGAKVFAAVETNGLSVAGGSVLAAIGAELATFQSTAGAASASQAGTAATS